MEYPRYKCHKEVGAAKIQSIERGADGSVIVHLEDGFTPVVLAHTNHQKDNFKHAGPGWYLVRYEGGHISASPGAVFEDGYALIESEAAPAPKKAKKSKAATEPAEEAAEQ